MVEIGVRELRQYASRWLARAKAGETIIVTERGRPIAQLGPISVHRPGSGLGRLVDEGRARPAEGTLATTLAAHGGPTTGPQLTTVLEELRADER